MNFYRHYLPLILFVSPIFWLVSSQNLQSIELDRQASYYSVKNSNKVLTYIAQDNNLDLANKITASYLQKKLLENFPDNLTLSQAEQIQQIFIQKLTPNLGSVVGYKAGLTNETSQKQFNVSQPVRGVLLEKMLLKSGAIIPANFAARPMIEGDLIVRVGNQSINTAKTPQEALAALDAVIPFLELPDLVYAPSVKLDGIKIVAINVGARLGIVGEPIALQPTAEWQKRLSNIQVIILNENNQTLAQGESTMLLNNPLNVVLWLRDNLQEQGIILKPGDLLSLGTITPLMPVKPNTIIRAQYLGIDPHNPMEISVQFIEGGSFSHF